MNEVFVAMKKNMKNINRDIGDTSRLLFMFAILESVQIQKYNKFFSILTN